MLDISVGLHPQLEVELPGGLEIQKRIFIQIIDWIADMVLAKSTTNVDLVVVAVEDDFGRVERECI